MKFNYTFSDISIQALKTKKSIIKTFNLSSMKELEIDLFFQKLTNRLERNLLNRKVNEVINNQNEIKKMINRMINIYNKDKKTL